MLFFSPLHGIRRTPISAGRGFSGKIIGIRVCTQTSIWRALGGRLKQSKSRKVSNEYGAAKRAQAPLPPESGYRGIGLPGTQWKKKFFPLGEVPGSIGPFCQSSKYASFS